jgi:hypothetical protein
MTIFNTGVLMHPTCELDVTMLPKVRVKNASVNWVNANLPEYACLVGELMAVIPEKRFQLVDISYANLHAGQGTCVDTGWHLDGRMDEEDQEHYALWCYGSDDSRTLFHKSRIEHKRICQPKTIEARHSLFSDILKHRLDDEDMNFSFVVPDQTPVSYSTFDFHKGRRSDSAGTRVLVRVMSSNHIKPSAPRRYRLN